MEAIKKIVNASWFKAGLLGLIGLFLLFDKDIFYSGIAFGVGFRELFLAFKKPQVETVEKKAEPAEKVEYKSKTKEKKSKK